ncbi:energy transducer TonB [Mucilaginibacter jinjuensis]|uniref:Energy transducer TonB n=1 Tax=Mucilaginibacter jinjuensis TaxID=1176721 RepID=A0ABY7T585_9SPHI|nr:energy transducer TonB [Mucilaginibacter jinjuensis]WCT11615.1 energy transducer TonB [Mucilaginibacter jinjuensis]
MKYIILIFSLLIISHISKAQKVIKTIKKDTINITGYVLKYDGTSAARGIYITSRNKDLTYDTYNQVAMTDEDGCFTLNGARLNDTLALQSATYNLKMPNRGARYMVITLPPEPKVTIADTIKVTAVRKYKPKTPSFKIIEYQFDCILPFANQQPEFPGGVKNFVKFINSKITYPQKAIDKNIEGNVEIGFTIERDGSLIDLKVLRGIGYGCDEEVLNAVKTSPRWKPGFSNGRPLRMQSSVNVEFILTDK